MAKINLRKDKEEEVLEELDQVFYSVDFKDPNVKRLDRTVNPYYWPEAPVE